MLVFDLIGGARPVLLEGSEGPVRGGAWRADGGVLATIGAADEPVRLWDFGHALPRPRTVRAIEPGELGPQAVAFTPEGRHVVTANPDGSIGVLRLAKAGDVFRVP